MCQSFVAGWFIQIRTVWVPLSRLWGSQWIPAKDWHREPLCVQGFLFNTGRRFIASRVLHEPSAKTLCIIFNIFRWVLEIYVGVALPELHEIDRYDMIWRITTDQVLRMMKQHIFSHLKIGGYLLWQLGNLSLGRNFGMREGVTFIEIGESFEQTPEILDDPKSWFCSISTPPNIKKTRPSQYSVRKDWSLLSTIKSGESKALIASTRCHWQVQGRFRWNHFRLEIPETRNHMCPAGCRSVLHFEPQDGWSTRFHCATNLSCLFDGFK